MYTVTQLKKMNTERLHRVYETVTGKTIFNPYQSRNEMVFEIACKKSKPVPGGVYAEFRNAIAMEMAKICWDMKVAQANVNVMVSDNSWLNQWFQTGERIQDGNSNLLLI